jgi:GMP synthase (glutamine-hydrolysing)
MAKRFLILRPGETAPEIEREFGDYDRWFASALAPHRLELVACDATREPVPKANGFAGAIVTGSANSVCRPEPWMDRLREWLRRAEQCGLPLLGVCFGCQILAAARGGRVVLNPEGWEIGAVDIDLAPAARTDPLFAGAPSPLPVLATHEDRVEALPPGAVLLAGNQNTPLQAFRIGDRIWGVQFHPEASAALIAALIRLRRTQLEEDARRHGLADGGHVERLLTGVGRFTIEPGRRILDRFIELC